MDKVNLFKQHVWTELYGDPESDKDRESGEESPSHSPERPERERKVYGAALPPDWPLVSSGQESDQTELPQADTHHSTSDRGSSSNSEGNDEDIRPRKRKRRRHNRKPSQASDQASSLSQKQTSNISQKSSSCTVQTQLTKNQKRKLKKKRQQKRRKEEERELASSEFKPPPDTRSAVVVYEGPGAAREMEEEKERKEDLIKRMKDVTGFLEAVFDVYNRDLLLQGKLALTGEASPVESLASAVLDSGQCQAEVDLLTRAKATALLGNPDLATQARQHLAGQSSLPSDLIKFVLTMLEYWVADVMKKT